VSDVGLDVVVLGPTPGILQTSPSVTSFHPRVMTSWLTKTTSSGRRERTTGAAPESIPA
jgi:hypothetical protein